MARSSASRLQLYSMPETTRGTIPSTALNTNRVTSIRKKATKQTVSSEELREDRQISDITEVGQAANLGLGVEWSYGTHDEWLAGLFFNAWNSPVTVTGSSDIVFAAAGKTITQSGASFDTQFKVGEIIRIRGTTSNGTNTVPKWFTIAALSATVITVSETVVDENNTSAQLYGNRLRNWYADVAGGGFVDKAYTVELKPSDLSSTFMNQRGMTFNTLDLNLTARQKVTAEFGLLGMRFATATATVGTGSAAAATTTSILNATSNVAALTATDGTALAAAVKALRLQFNNNLFELPAIGQKYAIDINPGQFGLTGSLDPYFESKTLMDAFIDHTEASLRVDLVDAAGNRQIISIPSLYYGGQDAGPEAPGNNQPTQLMLPIQARRHPTLGFTVQICRFPAP